VVAEVFLIAWRRSVSVPEGAEARLWLFGTARRVLANLARSNRRSRDLAARAAAEARLGQPSPSDPISPVVWRALERLSDSDRELVLLTVWDDLGPAEAASVLGLSPGTVRVRLHRARSRLREHLADLGVATQPEDPSAHATASTTIQEMS
jgi:RNA polymerase sigma factor (sigma-70 family)